MGLSKERSSLSKVDVVLPWEIDPKDEEHCWAINYITSRPFYDKIVWKRPDNQVFIDQISYLTQWLRGSRRFILCFSSSPTYMRLLYRYLSAAWSLTCNNRSEIFDIQELIDAIFNRDEVQLERVQDADLLVLPYTDKDHMGLRKVRGTLSNILIRRKAANLSTITDLFVTERPLGEDWYMKHAQKIVDVYGETSFDLFYGHSAKHVYVSSNRKGEKLND